MPQNDMENILLMAVFTVTKDDVRACANELGMPEEAVTDDVIEVVKAVVSQGIGDWREAIKSMVKEAIKKEATDCPLGMVCSSRCTWREVGKCLS